MSFQCTNCGKILGGTQYVGSPIGPRCLYCRGQLVGLQRDGRNATLHAVGLDPTVMDGYENVTAVYQNTSLITGPGDVRTEKDFLAPHVQSVDAAVQACGANIPAAMRTYWSNWMTNWQKFYAAKSSLYSASTDLDTVRKFNTQLNQFQSDVAPYCPDAASVATPPADLGTIGNATQTAKDLLNKANAAAQAFNTTARIALVVGGVLVGWFIYRQYKMAENVGPKVLPYLPKLLAL